jgi:hypothetical protein
MHQLMHGKVVTPLVSSGSHPSMHKPWFSASLSRRLQPSWWIPVMRIFAARQLFVVWEFEPNTEE